MFHNSRLRSYPDAQNGSSEVLITISCHHFHLHHTDRKLDSATHTLPSRTIIRLINLSSILQLHCSIRDHQLFSELSSQMLHIAFPKLVPRGNPSNQGKAVKSLLYPKSMSSNQTFWLMSVIQLTTLSRSVEIRSTVMWMHVANALTQKMDQNR